MTPLDISSAPPQTAPHETRLADYRPPAFLIDTVDLAFDLDEAATQVRSRLAVRRNPAAEPTAPLALDGEDVSLVRLALDGVELGANRYHIQGSKLIIPDMPDACTLEIETRIAPKDNTELSGLYTSNASFFTQCEAEGFRRITYFPDRPDVMARFTTTITADKARTPVMLSNGNPGTVQDAGNGRHRITWTDPHPKPCYLFALVAGDLVAVKDTFTTRSGRHCRTRYLRASWRRGPLRPRHALIAEVDGVGRRGVRPRIRPRRLQHRRRVRLQHGRDGEQRPERLQHEIRAGEAGHRDRRATIRASRRSSRTNTSTIGPATASPAATGSSFR